MLATLTLLAALALLRAVAPIPDPALFAKAAGGGAAAAK